MADDVFDAFVAAQGRGVMPTSLDTAGLRGLSAQVRARSFFTARGTNAIFVSKIKEVTEAMASGEMDDASARLALIETLRVLGYTPEGGFPDAPDGSVPPAIEGTLQDLSSFRRLDLIVRTNRELAIGAGLQMRGHTPERLEAAPAWELVRVMSVETPRDWVSRWAIAGGRLVDGRMVALKGDPVWGELGSSGNFDDALDVDHPPFAFNSGMGWREVLRGEAGALGVRGPQGETIDAFLGGPSRPRVLAGELPLPVPSISLRGVDAAVVEDFVKETKAVPVPGKPGRFDFSELLEEELAAADAAYGKEGAR
jgi:hypothetical protein